MDPDQRLKYHQDNSTELMGDLKDWLTTQLEDKKVEPNSSLGEAISYMLKHYKGMTLARGCSKRQFYIERTHCFTRLATGPMWVIFL